MRVLINGLQAGNKSGTGRYVEELCAALPDADAELSLSVLWPPEGPAMGGHPRRDVLPVVKSTIGGILFDHAGIRKMVRGTGADLIHYPASTGCLFPPCPVVQTVHDLCFMRRPEWFPAAKSLYYRLFISGTAPRADLVLADSQATAEDVRQLLGVPESRIRVVPLGVSPRFSPADTAVKAVVRTKYGLPEKFFLFVGTVEPRKNLPRVVQAWDRATGPGFPALVIAGRDGWKTMPTKDAFREARYSSGIIRLRHVEEGDLPALMSAATVFVWPSLMEGFGLPVLEAMACGTPVITSSTSSMPEVAGKAALCVNPESVGEIAEAMTGLVEDEQLRENLSMAGRARAAQFTWANTAKMTAAAYREVCGRSQ